MNGLGPWRIRHLDLGRPLPELPLEPGCQGLLVVFWWHGVPLGGRWFEAAELPIPAAAFAALAPRIIASAVGERLFGRGFEGRPPGAAAPRAGRAPARRPPGDPGGAPAARRADPAP